MPKSTINKPEPPKPVFDGIEFDPGYLTIKERLAEAKTLNQKQWIMAEMVEYLLRYARLKGYQVRIADAHAVDRHRAGSCHYLFLAVDIDLFKNGKYLDQTPSHKPLGDFWKNMGGIWGGSWGDGNHYSVEHEGRR
jgi:hypothetical protein